MNREGTAEHITKKNAVRKSIAFFFVVPNGEEGKQTGRQFMPGPVSGFANMPSVPG